MSNPTVKDLLASINISLTNLDTAVASLADAIKSSDPSPALIEIDTHIKALTGAVQAITAPTP
jgi:hypothetical protein